MRVALAIASMALGALVFLSGTDDVLNWLHQAAIAGSLGPFGGDLFRERWLTVSIAARPLLAISLVLVGWLLLKRTRNARTMAIGWSALALVWVACSLALQDAHVKALGELSQWSGDEDARQWSARNTARRRSELRYAAAVHAALPLVLLVFLSRRSVVEELRGTPAPKLAS
jgi:hypothetical protein